MPRMDEQPAVRQTKWQGEIDVQIGQININMIRIKTARTEILRLKAVARADSATIDDLATYDYWLNELKKKMQAETDRFPSLL